MGKKENFTAERVAGFKCPAGKQQTIFWDGKVPGLGLRVTARGARAYIFETRLHGKTLRLTIGDPRTWTIAQAQAKATSCKALTDQGIDPRQLASEQRAKADAAHAEAKRRETLVSDAWNAYVAHQMEKMPLAHIERGKKWGARHLLDHERLTQAGGAKRKRGQGLTKPGPLYPLLQRRMIDVTAALLKEWQRNEAATRANNARQAFEAFRAFWRWCAKRPEYKGIINLEAVEDSDLRSEVPGRKPKQADALAREQLTAWFAAVRTLSNPVVSAYLQILLLTGARREELAALRWEHVNFRWRSLTIRDKVDGERTIPLTPYVAALLADLKHRNETRPTIKKLRGNITAENKDLKPSPWVFSSPTASDGKLAEPRIAHNRALIIAGLPHVSVHGLRRTFASMAEWQAEMPTGVVAQIMGHKPSATAEKHYKRRPLDLLREWHSKYEHIILQEAGIEFAPLERLRAVKS